ncbi:MAG: DUF59 domain-containing protein [Acidobacteriota bacterium]
MEKNSGLKNKVIEKLKTCYDPEIPLNIYEMGLIYGIEIDEKQCVKIEMTLTSPNCPVADSLPKEVEDKIRSIPEITSVKIDLVWDPPFSKDMMSDEAKLLLGIF